MTAHQISLLDPARQLELLPKPPSAEGPEPLPEPCAWCDRLGCEGGPDCRYVSPSAPPAPRP